MNLANSISLLYAGGPGSGCNPAVGKCGRTVTLYHGTTEAIGRKIAKQGLSSGKSVFGTEKVHGKGWVHFSKDLDDAHNFGYEAATQRVLNRKGDTNPIVSQEMFPGGVRYAVVRADVPEEMYKKMQADPENKKDWRRYRGDVPSQYVTHVAVYKSGAMAQAVEAKHMTDVKGDHKTIDQPAGMTKGSVSGSEHQSNMGLLMNSKQVSVDEDSVALDRRAPGEAKRAFQALQKAGFIEQSSSGEVPVGRGGWGKSYFLTNSGTKLFLKVNK